ncbi:hypothetical protein GCM10023108_39700 [Saccharopolyspora hordei]
MPSRSAGPRDMRVQQAGRRPSRLANEAPRTPGRCPRVDGATAQRHHPAPAARAGGAGVDRVRPFAAAAPNGRYQFRPDWVTIHLIRRTIDDRAEALWDPMSREDVKSTSSDPCSDFSWSRRPELGRCGSQIH